MSASNDLLTGGRELLLSLDWLHDYVESSFDDDRQLDALANREGTAAVWLSTGWSPPHRPWVYAAGKPEALAELFAAGLSRWPDVHGSTIEREALDAVPPGLSCDAPDDWDWWSTTSAPPPLEQASSVVELGDSDAPAIQALLDVASPEHWAPPGHPQVRRWWGIKRAGQLVCCACETRPVRNVPHIASVATDSHHRGQGLARATVGVLTGQLLEEGVTRVTLGSYAYNEAAAAVYRSLGYQVRHRWRSGRLRPSRVQEPSAGCAEP